jgi:acyl-CoA synthetase (AMP-forming)/AMP-acid ligase II
MSSPADLPQFTLDDYETQFADRHLLHQVIAKWAAERPHAPALIAADGSRTVDWLEFDRLTTALACELLRLGFRKGDFLVTQLPMSVDHVLLEYACFRIGVIVAPLDLRFSPAEVIRAVEILRPRGFVYLGHSAPLDFRELGRAVLAMCAGIEHFISMGVADDLPATRLYSTISAPAMSVASGAVPAQPEDLADLAAITNTITGDDGALVIFTTGSTGSPKPALLSHRSITVQNMCLCGAFFGGDSGSRTLVNLPASHVGGQTEILMTTLFGGGAAVLLEIFDAARSLRAVAQHRVEILGQIPAMFNLQWMLKDFAGHDLTSLKFAAYGGNAVSRPFVERLAAMAPLVGTGMGITEASGFCTYVQADAAEHELILAGLGHDMPIYPCSIRQPMRADGAAGDELDPGQIGHICFRGPQTFSGYVNDPEATARTVSRDGFLYTGDLGFKDASGLHLTGRDKWVIKSMGYQVFPGDIEAHVCGLTAKVSNCVAVGVPHAVLSEAVVAVVERKPEVELTVQELDRHARGLASYMRPRLWIILDPGQMPLNRIAKPNYFRAQQMARDQIAALRTTGQWDGGRGAGE